MSVFGTISTNIPGPVTSYQVDDQPPTVFNPPVPVGVQHRQRFFHSGYLDPGQHVLVLTNMEDGDEVWVDYFEVEPAPQTISSTYSVALTCHLFRSLPHRYLSECPTGLFQLYCCDRFFTSSFPIASDQHSSSHWNLFQLYYSSRFFTPSSAIISDWHNSSHWDKYITFKKEYPFFNITHGRYCWIRRRWSSGSSAGDRGHCLIPDL